MAAAWKASTWERSSATKATCTRLPSASPSPIQKLGLPAWMSRLSMVLP
jgi:hypothetical protein